MWKHVLIAALVGRPKSRTWSCGESRIATVFDALLWRLGSLPCMDASVNDDGTVMLYRRC